MIKPLTKLQEKFREDYHNGLLVTNEIEDRLTRIRIADDYSLSDETAFINLLMKEKETGVYLYPPPPVTYKNMHLHMIEPDDSWMFAD